MTLAMPKKVKNVFETELWKLSELSESEQTLIERAKLALDRAYAPYSNFLVGCAVQLADDTIVIGNNQENAAYPSGLCAERVALFHVGSNYNGIPITQIAIAAKGKNMESYAEAGPCGSCRQVMMEYQNKQDTSIELLLLQENEEVLKIKVRDLLPLAFDGSVLDK